MVRERTLTVISFSEPTEYMGISDVVLIVNNTKESTWSYVQKKPGKFIVSYVDDSGDSLEYFYKSYPEAVVSALELVNFDTQED